MATKIHGIAFGVYGPEHGDYPRVGFMQVGVERVQRLLDLMRKVREMKPITLDLVSLELYYWDNVDWFKEYDAFVDEDAEDADSDFDKEVDRCVDPVYVTHSAYERAMGGQNSAERCETTYLHVYDDRIDFTSTYRHNCFIGDGWESASISQEFLEDLLKKLKEAN